MTKVMGGRGTRRSITLAKVVARRASRDFAKVFYITIKLPSEIVFKDGCGGYVLF